MSPQIWKCRIPNSSSTQPPTAEAQTEDAGVEYNAWGGRVRTIDDYMLGLMSAFLEGTALDVPRDKKKSKKAKDLRKR